jgi:hypothetical protein
LREEESPILPVEGREEERPGSLDRLNLELRRQYVWLLTPGLEGKAIEPRGEQSQTIPILACLKLPLRDNIPKFLFWSC